MNVNEISKVTQGLDDDPFKGPASSAREELHATHLEHEIDNLTRVISKKERKRMLAREHNRAYQAGELNRPVDLKDIVRGVVQHAAKSLDIKPNIRSRHV